MYMWTAQQTQMETHSFFLAADDGSVQNNKGHEKETQTKSTVLQKEDGNTRDHYQNKTGGGGSYKPKLACVMIMIKANTRLWSSDTRKHINQE